MKKSEKIFIELKKRLTEGFYPENSKFPSESMLADEFNVNKMTINKIVSLLTEQNYLKRGIRGAGTRVNEISSLPRGTIGFLSPLSSYTVKVLRGVYAETMRYNFNVIVESPPISELEHRLKMLKNSGVKGIISVTYGKISIPGDMIIFCVDNYPSGVEKNIHYINSDNFQGGTQMMTEIMRRGHREILIFSTERFVIDPNAPKTPRLSGFHSVMQKNDLNDFEARTFYGAPESIEDAKYFLKKYLAEYPDTTIIAADSDGSAALLHTAALQLGIDCPGKIALTGFGNVSPLPIANVNQSPERQGELAARYLINYTLTGNNDAPFETSVDTSLVNIEQIPIILHNK